MPPACLSDRSPERAIRFNPIHGVLEHVWPIVVEAEHETSVHLDAIAVEDVHSPSIVLGARCLLTSVIEILARQRLESNKDTRAARKRHRLDQRRVIRHVNRDGGAPDHVQRLQRPAQRLQVFRPRTKVVVDEHAVRFFAGRELLGDMLDVSHLVGHHQPLRRQVAEPTAIVAAACGDEAGRREEPASRKNPPARRRIEPVGTAICRDVTVFQCPSLKVAQDLGPELNTITDRDHIGVRSNVLRTAQHVQPSKHNHCTSLAKPASELVSPAGKRQVHRDAHDGRERVRRWRPLQQVLVPIADVPVGRCRARDRSQCQCWR